MDHGQKSQYPNHSIEGLALKSSEEPPEAPHDSVLDS